MVSFKVQHRSYKSAPSSSSLLRSSSFPTIAFTFCLFCCPIVAVEAYALHSHTSASGGDHRLMATLVDAHNLIAAAAAFPSLNESSTSDTFFGDSLHRVATVHSDGTPKVCAFRLHRLADAPFDNHITVLMPVRGPTFVRRQAYMLNKLEARFRNAGYTHVQFVIIYAVELEEEGHSVERENATATTTTSDSTDNLHSPNNADSDVRVSIEDRFERVDSMFNVTVLRRPVDGIRGMMVTGADGEPINMEKLFRPTAAYVFDACGRFAYLIYAPWSSIQRPYIKASILSTMYDAPCGQCEGHLTTYPVQSTTSPTQPIGSSATAVIDSTTEANSSTDRPAIDEITDSADERSSNMPSSTLTDLSSTEPSSAASPNPKRHAPMLMSVQPDTSFVMPIRVLAPIVHAHRDWTETIAASSSRTGSGANIVHPSFNNASQYYLKYNYIVMRSDDPNYHAHLPSDRPERLALIPRATITTNVESDVRSDDWSIDSAVLNESHFVTDYGKRFVSQTIMPPSHSVVEAVTALNTGDTTKNTSSAERHEKKQDGHLRNQFPHDFVNLEEIPRHSKQRSNTGRMVGVQNAGVDAEAEEASLAANGQEERAIDEHYSKIIQWIQFNL